MNESLHHLLMTDHLLFQKALLAGIRETGLTLGQPKVLDYLLTHDGAIQREIAEACHIEPATITSLLAGMEKKGLIVRQNQPGNRRSLFVYLTENGKKMAMEVDRAFQCIEKQALTGFDQEEAAALADFLARVNENMKGLAL